MAHYIHKARSVSVRLACVIVGVSLSTFYYEAKRDEENQEVAQALLRLTTENKRWGFLLCFLHLRNVQGKLWNHKRVYRIYCELGLNLRIKPRTRLVRHKPDPLAIPTSINRVWSMDFMSDNLADGRSLRTFNVIDDYNREGLGIEVGLSIPSERVIQSLERIIEWRGKPDALRMDNGPEYVSAHLTRWAQKQGIALMYIQPGKPTQNAYIERFNRTARHEWLDMHSFDSVEHAQELATQWLWRYNNDRPHMGIGGVPPRYLASQHALGGG